MIKATELRLGNIILHNDAMKKVVGIISDGNEFELWLHNSAGFWKIEEENTFGIPITEEWLEKLGFEENEVPKNKASLRIMKLGEFQIEFSTGHWWLDNYKGGHISLGYVHDLQNLYFTLTGKELKIKQPA